MTTTQSKATGKATTQQFIEIDDIHDDIMIMKDKSAAVVIEVGAINFYLLSQEEQTATIYSYSGLLNSLSFPVQILIMSKRMDISVYLEYLKAIVGKTTNEVTRNRLSSYEQFIRNIVKKNTVLQKRFFFVVPFSSFELGVTASSNKSIKKEYIVSRAKTSLYPKRDHLLRQLARIGLKTTVMYKQDLVELFYNVYNPSFTGKRLAPVDTYTDVVLTTT
jgi:hypothetical protein